MQTLLKVYTFMTIKVAAFETACLEMLGTTDAAETLINQYSIGAAHGTMYALQALGMPLPNPVGILMIHEIAGGWSTSTRSTCRVIGR